LVLCAVFTVTNPARLVIQPQERKDHGYRPAGEFFALANEVIE